MTIKNLNTQCILKPLKITHIIENKMMGITSSRFFELTFEDAHLNLEDFFK